MARYGETRKLCLDFREQLNLQSVQLCSNIYKGKEQEDAESVKQFKYEYNTQYHAGLV